MRRTIPLLILTLAVAACGSSEPDATDPSVDPAPPEKNLAGEPEEASDTEPAEEEKSLEKVGTFSVTGYRASFIGSAAVAKGVLDFQGKKRKFRVSGLGVGGYGVSKTNAYGSVYNMTDVDDFTGAYVMARSGVTVGDEGLGGGRWVTNERGVKLYVKAKTKGLQLNLGADGMVITWDD